MMRGSLSPVPTMAASVWSVGLVLVQKLESLIRSSTAPCREYTVKEPLSIWTTWPGPTGPGQLQPHWHRGRLLTAKSLVGRPEEKQRLGLDYDALAVDMESAALADACTKAGTPFGSVRAVSDEVDGIISPQIAKLLSEERVSLRRVIATAIRRPGLLPELRRLATDTRKAQARLAEGLIELISLPGHV